MKPTNLKHLLQIRDLGLPDVQRILAAARSFSQNSQPISLLAGKSVGLIFFESSTQTRMTFETATRNLGGTVINFSPSGNSLQKGESLHDIAKKCLSFRPHVLVVRHPSAGSPMRLAAGGYPIPIINSEDGFHEHPTQAFADILTLEQSLGDLRGKKVVILGDIAHSRVARSNIALLRMVGATVSVCGPPTLMPPRPDVLGVEFAYRPEELLPDADAVMIMRLQMERQNRAQIPSTGEYASIWGLDERRFAMLKVSAPILHAGPMHRGIEISAQVLADPRIKHLDQLQNSIYARMASIGWALEAV